MVPPLPPVGAVVPPPLAVVPPPLDLEVTDVAVGLGFVVTRPAPLPIVGAIVTYSAVDEHNHWQIIRDKSGSFL